MFDRLHIALGKKSIITILFALAITCGVLLNSIHHNSFIGYHPQSVTGCTTDILSLPCSPDAWSFLLSIGALVTWKLFRFYKDGQDILSLRLSQPHGMQDINYLELHDPLHRCLRRGIICRLVYH